MDPVRWAVLATGSIASTVAADIAATPGAELVAVGSRDLGKAEAFAREHGVRRAYGSYEEAAGGDDVDVVYVATPHAFHRENVEMCFAAGKAVLCEKALTLNARDAEALVTEARRRDLFFMEAMWMRCNPVVRAASELARDGAIGQVTSVGADLGFVPDKPPGHRLYDPALGASAVLDIGIYPLTFAWLFLGPPDDIRSVGVLSDRGIDLACASVLRYGDGSTASTLCTLLAQSPCRAYVAGDAGRIELPPRLHSPRELTLTIADGPTTRSFEVRGNGYVDEIEEVDRCLREGLTESPLVPLDDTVALLHQMDAIRAEIGSRLPGDDGT